MTKFIRVTEIHTTGSKIDMLVNTDLVATVKQSDRKTDTHIGLKDGRYLFVKETTEQIWNMINLDTSKAPVIMAADEALKYYKEK